jgi:putative hemolysin
MVPRNRVVALDKSSSTEEVRRAFLEKGHQRLPVYDANLDNVIGYVAAKDVLQTALERQALSVDDLMRPAVFFPEAMKAVKVLKEMQEKHQKLAVIVDERGGMAGIVTMEDLLEELVGEIFSEDDRGAPASVRVRPDGSPDPRGEPRARHSAARGRAVGHHRRLLHRTRGPHPGTRRARCGRGWHHHGDPREHTQAHSHHPRDQARAARR